MNGFVPINLFAAIERGDKFSVCIRCAAIVPHDDEEANLQVHAEFHKRIEAIANEAAAREGSTL